MLSDFPRAMIKEDHLFSFSGFSQPFINTLHHSAEQKGDVLIKVEDLCAFPSVVEHPSSYIKVGAIPSHTCCRRWCGS